MNIFTAEAQRRRGAEYAEYAEGRRGEKGLWPTYYVRKQL